jgi:hypothetical protein
MKENRTFYKLSYEELTLVSNLMWLTTIYARKSMAGWLMQRPRKDDMFQAAGWVHGMEEACEILAMTPPDRRDLSAIKAGIKNISALITEIDQEFAEEKKTWTQ